MANIETLRPVPFTSENQPAYNPGRPKGSPNRATVYRRILESKMNVEMPNGDSKEMTVYEAIALGQAKSAIKGNTKAWQEIQDSLHGKITEKMMLTTSSDLANDIAQRLIDKGWSADEAQAFVRAEYPEELGQVD